MADQKIKLMDTLATIGTLVALRYPLSFAEYHIATAVGVIYGEMPYEEFYKQCWSEDSKGNRRYDPVTPVPRKDQ